MVEPAPRVVAYALWGTWLVTWQIAAVWSSRTVKRPALGRQLPDRLITVLGALLLFVRSRGDGFLEVPRWKVASPFGWGLTIVVALGLGFAWWARLHLGRLWSGTVTQKEGHRIIDTGPYAIVRHPIYTGLLLAAFATAALVETARGLAGAALITLGFFLKARLEERFLHGDLGAAYDEYRRRVPMLIPSIRS